MAYNPEMEKLKALQALTQQITNQYGGGNDVKSGILQNEAYVQGARQLGMTDADIAQTIRGVPWNDSTRPIPAQSLRADELGPAPADAISGTIPAPAAPAPMPAPAQAQQAKPSFFQRMGQRFDQAATGGVIDPTTLTKDQRRMLRAQLLMNVGGALSQNRPIGEGFQQQYNALTKQKAEQQALQARKAVAEAFGGGIGSREQFMGAVQNLFSQGMIDQAMELLSKADTLFPKTKYSTNLVRVTLRNGETVPAVIADDGSIKTYDDFDIPPEEVVVAIPEGGSVGFAQKGGTGASAGKSGAVTTVLTRPKTPKLRRQANIPGYDNPVYEGEDGQFYEWVDE